MFQQDHLTDVMLAAEGRSIPCHKMLLAAASKFFRDKFITNPESLEHNILDIDDIDFDTLTSIVSFIYSGKIELTVEKTEKLIPGSVHLMLRELTDECKTFLEKQSTYTSVCVSAYKIAKANSLDEIAQKAWKVMLDKCKDINTTSAFKELSKAEFETYIRDKELNVVSEDPVFEAVVAWVKHDMDNRTDTFENLLEYVTLSHCSLRFLRDVAMQEPLMKHESIWRVAEALAAHASAPSLQLGTPRRAQRSKKFLLAVIGDNVWVLRQGDSEWLNETSVAGKNLPFNRICMIEDGILFTGGDKSRRFSRQCYKLSLPTLDWVYVPDLNVARDYHTSVCVGGRVYVLGGVGNSGVLQSVEYLNKNTESWCVTTAMPEALYGHTAVSYKHYIYIFGGFHTSEYGSTQTFMLDTVNKKWSKKADVPYVCRMATAVVYRDKIYTDVPMVDRENYWLSYNPKRDLWQIHSKPNRIHASVGATIVWGNRILLVYGHGKTLIEEYNPETDTWAYWKHSLPETGCSAAFAVHL